jgi:outer membrane protein
MIDMPKTSLARGAFVLVLAALGATEPRDAAAQQAPAAMSLEEAVQLARRYNPAFQRQRNDEAVADWNVRAAYGAILPSLTLSSSLDWQGEGVQRFGLFSGEDLGLTRTPPYYFSSYGIRLNMNLSGGTLFRMAQERAQRQSTVAAIEAAAFTLEADVTRQYLAALRARDNVALARRELEAAEEALRLADARAAAGAATRLDAAQAEVERGRAQVDLLQATAAAETEKLRLLQRVGVEMNGDFELTSQLVVFEPTWSLEDLSRAAMQQHPQLVAARAAESAGAAAARAARMQYLPSVNISGGWSGYTRMTRNEAYLIGNAEESAQNRIDNCMRTNDIYSRLAQPLPPDDCSRHALTDTQRSNILAANSQWPFNFTEQPPAFALTLTLPVFNGFTREAQLQTAAAAASDARHLRREEELNRRTTVATSFLALQTAYRAVGIEERNVAAAAEQLELAQERYRLGAGSILELTQAQATRARAEQAHLVALYSFHENLAELEAAVGHRLR